MAIDGHLFLVISYRSLIFSSLQFLWNSMPYYVTFSFSPILSDDGSSFACYVLNELSEIVQTLICYDPNILAENLDMTCTIVADIFMYDFFCCLRKSSLGFVVLCHYSCFR